MRVPPEGSEPAVVYVSPASGRASLRLKSWLPEPRGRLPVVLAGLELPSEVGAILHGAMRVMCIGPGDWLVVSQQHSAPSLRAQLEPEARQVGVAVVDLTDGLTTLEIRGAVARELLSKGCGIDFHPRSFPPGRCMATRFAQIPVVIECLDESPHFQLHVARSYFEYLYSWLKDARLM